MSEIRGGTVAESRWQRFKRWWVASDPDDLAREEFRLASERRDMVTSADRLASTVVLEEQREASARYLGRHDPG
jgi:hypothetical protein